MRFIFCTKLIFTFRCRRSWYWWSAMCASRKSLTGWPVTSTSLTLRSRHPRISPSSRHLWWRSFLFAYRKLTRRSWSRCMWSTSARSSTRFSISSSRSSRRRYANASLCTAILTRFTNTYPKRYCRPSTAETPGPSRLYMVLHFVTMVRLPRRDYLDVCQKWWYKVVALRVNFFLKNRVVSEDFLKYHRSALEFALRKIP